MTTRVRAFGWVLVVASVMALALSVYSSYRARAYATCQAEAAEQDRAALRQVITAVLAAGEDDRARLVALQTYLATAPPARCI